MTSKPGFEEEAANCHNCGAAVSYHYCALCGQETRLHVPSASEFIHEFVGHYVAFEGRLWKTLVLLLFKPGFLSWEYIQGRRVRYVQPLRVYLTCSILFFAVLKFGPPLIQLDRTDPAPPAAAAPAKATPTAKAVAAPATPTAGPAAAARKSQEQQLAEAALGYLPTLEKRIKAFRLKSEAEQIVILSVAFYAYVPYAIFFLMPLFAGFLKLLYLGSGRRYGEHLLFALHANAFAFAMLAVLILLERAGVGGLFTFALVIWVVLYLPMAMQRVYGGYRLVTGLRWIGLATVHMLSLVLAVLLAVGWGLMH